MRANPSRLRAALALLVVSACSSKPSPRPQPLPRPATAERFGTAHPFFLIDAAPDLSWAAFCQARRDTDGDGHIRVTADTMHGKLHGDELEILFAVGPGPGAPIDALVASSPDGRWVVVIAGGRMVLHDIVGKSRVDLRAAVEAGDRWPPFPEQSGSFNSSATHFVYARPGADKRWVPVVRELASGTEATIEVRGRLWHAHFADPAKPSDLRLVEVVRDADGDGLELPTVWTTGPTSQCQGPGMLRSSSTDSDDELAERVVSLAIAAKPITTPERRPVRCRPRHHRLQPLFESPDGRVWALGQQYWGYESDQLELLASPAGAISTSTTGPLQLYERSDVCDSPAD